MTTEDQNSSHDSFPNTQRTAQAPAFGTLMAVSSGVPAAERAISVVETVELSATASRIWGAIQDFSTWPSWHPAFASTQMLQGDGHSNGAVRVLVTQDGARFTEERLDFDPAVRSCKYRIIESPAPVVDYVSTIQVLEAATGSTVVWSSRFNVKAGSSESDVKRLISAVYRAGLDNLASVFA
jgi:hypothetical protein